MSTNAQYLLLLNQVAKFVRLQCFSECFLVFPVRNVVNFRVSLGPRVHLGSQHLSRLASWVELATHLDECQSSANASQ